MHQYYHYVSFLFYYTTDTFSIGKSGAYYIYKKGKVFTQQQSCIKLTLYISAPVWIGYVQDTPYL
jgi:hypothetical protein